MSQSNIKICKFTGEAIKTYLPAIARLRIEVFRDYPYLFEGNMHDETQYLKKYANCKDAVLVIVFDGSEIVGVSTGIPLENEIDEVKKAFVENDHDISSYYYFSESMLLKKYRGRGLGHHFYDERETHAQKLNKYKHLCLCCITRSDDDPRKPDDYIPLDDFWKKRGYVKHPELICEVGWRDLNEEENSTKSMIFWIKNLSKETLTNSP